MSEITSGMADIGGAKLYYEMHGAGETLVLCHAGFVDSGMWNSQWEAFAQHYRVIRFDMRGNGKSDRATAPVCRRDDAYKLLKALGVERAILLGCSMGGEVVIDLALEHPELVSSLIAVSAVPSGFQMQGAPPRYLMEMMAAVQAGDVEKASELQIRIWVDGMFREPDQVDPAVRQQAAAMNRIIVQNGTFATAGMQPLNPLTPPAVTRLKDIHIPSLFIAGALDHPEILRAQDEMHAAVRGAQRVIIPNTAHVPNMEQPERFNHAVLDFLSKRS
jgi:2-hydroxy-6-oxonona-2,4-dienedioate hydrolase